MGGGVADAMTSSFASQYSPPCYRSKVMCIPEVLRARFVLLWSISLYPFSFGI